MEQGEGRGGVKVIGGGREWSEGAGQEGGERKCKEIIIIMYVHIIYSYTTSP